nr:quorum sensing histidine kinase QseC [uncultured Moellerella sp.]
MKVFSLRLKLGWIFIILSLITWGTASLLAWHQTKKTIDELFDTQQMVFAKRLSVIQADMAISPINLLRTKKMLRKNRGEQDDDALAFAIFTTEGQMVLNDGDNGRKFLFNFRREGFSNSPIAGSNDKWRIVWLYSEDKNYLIAVGQELEYRQDMALTIISTQLLPWLVSLPILLILFIWLLTRSLKSLSKIANQLRVKQSDDLTPLVAEKIPSEVKPMFDALNALFQRIDKSLARERQFTSDAAHELRSPLAALQVQAEVVQLAGDDQLVRENAVTNLTEGIERATRIIDQLLTLSRLESLAQLEDIEAIAWLPLVQNAIADIHYEAASHNIELALTEIAPARPIQGQTLLLSVLLRNLLHNAIRYGESGGKVDVILKSQSLIIEDNGPGVAPDVLLRLGERFYRPAGQEKTGSGLGLSIVMRIAQLHQLQIKFANRQEGGFRVTINW